MLATALMKRTVTAQLPKHVFDGGMNRRTGTETWNK